MPSRWKAYLTQDLPLKGVSLLLGGGIWYGVYQNNLDTYALEGVPVEILLPQNRSWEILWEPGLVDRLKITGPKRVIDQKIRNRNFTLRVQIPEGFVPDGSRRKIQIGPEHLHPMVREVALKTRLKEGTEDEIEVAIDQRDTVELAVVLDLEPPPPGFQVKSQVNPALVKVKGPRTLLQQAKAEGASIHTVHLNPGYRGEGNLPPVEVTLLPFVKLSASTAERKVTCEPSAVTVLVNITQASESKRLENVPLYLATPPGFARTAQIPPSISVLLKGPRKVKLADGAEKTFNDLSPSDVRATVRISPNLKPSVYDLFPVEFQLPEGVKLAEDPAPTVKLVLQ